MCARSRALEALELKAGVSPADCVRAAYLRLAKQHHPDLTSRHAKAVAAEAKFKEVSPHQPGCRVLPAPPLSHRAKASGRGRQFNLRSTSPAECPA